MKMHNILFKIEKGKKLFFFMILLFSFKTYGQVVLTGEVIEKNKQVIPYANVVLTKIGDANFIQGSITDESGKFELKIHKNGSYKVTISFVGFTDWSKTIEVKSNESINLGTITLLPSAMELDEVVIKSSRKIIEKKESKLIFNVNKSPMKNGYNGIELLRRTPNIFIGINDEVLMRNEEVTIMINGKISNLTGGELTNYLSSLRSDDIKNIEIQTHSSANRDGESSGGVINIILKKISKGYSGSIKTDYTIKEKGYFDNVLGGNFNYGEEKWNVYGSYNYSISKSISDIKRNYDYFLVDNLIKTDITNERLGTKKHNYQFGLVKNLSKNHIIGFEFFGTNITNPYTEKGSVKVIKNNSLIEKGSLVFNNTDKSDLYNGVLNYTWKIDDLGSNLKVFTDYSNQNLMNQNTNYSRYTLGVYENNINRNNSTAKTKILSTQTDLEKKINSNSKISTGFKYVTTERSNFLSSSVTENNKTIYSFKYDEQILAGYLSFNKTIGNYFLDAGIRVENTHIKKLDLLDKSKIQQNYTNYFPSIYISRDLNKNNSISVGYSKKIKRPYFRDLNNYVIKVSDYSYSIGNPDLEPESIHKFEIGFKQKKQSFLAYYTKSTNAIVSYYFNKEESLYRQRINGGAKSEIGVEYNRNSNINSWWYINEAIGIFQRDFYDTNQKAIYNRKIGGNIKLSNIFKINKTTSVDVSGYYISPYNYDYSKQFEYYSLDVMAKKSFLNNKLICRISVNDIFNMLDFKNQSNLQDVKRTFSNKPLTRNIKLSIIYNFSNKNRVTKRKNTSKNDNRRRL